jgi:hypothetical protein
VCDDASLEVGDVRVAYRVGPRSGEGDAKGFVEVLGAGIQHGAESEPLRLGHALLYGGRWTDFSRQADLADGDGCGGSARSLKALAMARAIARSAPGSVTRIPPTVET